MYCTSTQYTPLDLKSFTNPDSPEKDFPKLKGKGAEAKDLLPAMCAAWEQFARDWSEGVTFTSVKNALGHQARVQDTITQYRRDALLPRDAAEQLRESAQSFLLEYAALARAADQEGVLLWNATPKLHWYDHLAQRAMFLNPRVGSTFLDEDYMGCLKVLVHSCSFGVAAHEAPPKAAAMYRWAQHFRVQDLHEESVA